MKRIAPALFALTLVLSLSSAASADDDLEFEARLRGSEEVPNPVNTDARGSAQFEVNEDFTKIDYKLKVKRVNNALGVAGAHIHCAPRGQNGGVILFLAGVHPGGLSGKLRVQGTLTDQNILDGSCGNTIAQIVDAMIAGDTYVNVHSLDWPAGEVRGQIEFDD